MEAFLSIEDSFKGHRASVMFSGDGGALTTLRSIQDQPIKERLVCICIHSLIILMQRLFSVKEVMSICVYMYI
jgi:hypothetical protein